MYSTISFTTVAAVWGATIATIALIWNIIRDARDRGMIKVGAMIGKMYPDHTDREYLVITMINVGRRPVTVKGWGGMKRRDAKGLPGLVVTPRGLPRVLKEGEDHMEFTDDLSILSPEIRKIYVWDAAAGLIVRVCTEWERGRE